MKRIIAAGSMLAVLSPAGAVARPVNTHHRPCDKLFTVRMGRRAGDAVYSGTRHVTLRNLRLLGYIERCQRNPTNQPRVRTYDRHMAVLHSYRVALASTPWRGPVVASWYNDAGTTGCGFHTTYGVATDVVPCGGTVRLKGPGGAIITATRDDSPGPGVAAGGRTFDVNPETKAALGCGDLCDVWWSPTG